MTQKPVLRAEVYARALRASQRGRKHNTSTPLYSKVETVHELVLKPDLSRFCVCFCIEESAPLFSLLGTPRQEAPLLLWCQNYEFELCALITYF